MNKIPNEDSPSYPTPLEFQEEKVENQHIKFYGFDTLFPDSNLGEVFDSNSAFRVAVRAAVRNDYFIFDATLTDEVNAMIRDPR